MKSKDLPKVGKFQPKSEPISLIPMMGIIKLIIIKAIRTFLSIFFCQSAIDARATVGNITAPAPVKSGRVRKIPLPLITEVNRLVLILLLKT